MEPILEYLSRYTSISEEEIHAIGNIVHFSSHTKNERFHQQGVISKKAAFILKGSVREYYTDDSGVDHTIDFVLEYEPLIAWDSFREQIPAGITAIALEPVDLIWTGHTELFSFLDKYPKYQKVTRDILGQYMTHEKEQRKLLRIASSRDRFNALCEFRPELINRVPLQYIASYLGMSPETLSRIRSEIRS